MRLTSTPASAFARARARLGVMAWKEPNPMSALSPLRAALGRPVGAVTRLRAAVTAPALVASSVTGVAIAAPTAQAHTINPSDFQQVTLAKGVPEVGEPISLAVLPDRSVLLYGCNGTAAQKWNLYI